MEKDSIFKIDFIELAFLMEACIPSKPIARTMFWRRVIDEDYYKMTKNERKRLFDWMNRNEFFKESLKKEEDSQLFNARFDPDNQYLVHTDFKGKKETNECFKWDNGYHLTKQRSVNEDYITKVEKIL